MSEQIPSPDRPASPRPDAPGQDGRHAEDPRPQGPRSITEIGTLPPLEAIQAGLPVDPTTGEPRRPVLAAVAMVCYGLAALSSAIGLALAWWGSIHVRTFGRATRLMAWTDPRPGSLASVLLAAAMMAIGAAMVAMPAILAVNTWLGRRWVRWGAIGGLAAAALALMMNDVSWLALPFSLAAGVVVWTPPVRSWLQLWATVRSQPDVERFESRPVHYGRIAEHY